MTWIKGQTQKCISLSTMMIMAKAKGLISVLKEEAGPNHNAKFTVALSGLSIQAVLFTM
jgi:hypothetical protein